MEVVKVNSKLWQCQYEVEGKLKHFMFSFDSLCYINVPGHEIAVTGESIMDSVYVADMKKSDLVEFCEWIRNEVQEVPNIYVIMDTTNNYEWVYNMDKIESLSTNFGMFKPFDKFYEGYVKEVRFKDKMYGRCTISDSAYETMLKQITYVRNKG